MTARLVVSMSGLTSRTVDSCIELSDTLDSRGVPVTWLVAPHVVDRVTLAFIGERTLAGDRVALHGFGYSSPRRNLWIGEFSALPAHEAGLRLTAANAMLDRLGLVTDCFVPPHWITSKDILTALRAGGFRIYASAKAVYDVRGGIQPGRILGFSHSNSSEPWWCFALVRGAGRIARRGGLVRLTMDADNLQRDGLRQALLDAVDIALHRSATPTTYPELIPPASVRPFPVPAPDDNLWSQTA